jgi:hypothetical protein
MPFPQISHLATFLPPSLSTALKHFIKVGDKGQEKGKNILL